MNNKIINIGIVSKGRLKEFTEKLLKKKKLKIFSDRGERDLFGKIKDKSNIRILFAEAKAIAPPDPPSPIITEIIGTLKDTQHSIELDIASACPLCSAPIPG